MKQGIHPKYELTSIQCACGAQYTVRSTRPTQRLEICAACHPFFTGKLRLVDTAGRVDKFKRRYAKFVTPDAKPEPEAQAQPEAQAEPEAKPEPEAKAAE